VTALIFDIKRFAIHDGPGIRTTVFFKGCPLDCWWCHNPESLKNCSEKSKKTYRLEGKEIEVEELTGYEITPDELMEEIIKDYDFMKESGGGVSFSGGEPLMQHNFLKEIIQLCKGHDIHTLVDTSGYASERVFKLISDISDLLLFDLKHPHDQQHRKYTSVSNRPIFKNLDYAHESGASLIIRIPLVPAVNDGKVTREMIRLLKKRYPRFKRVDILPYHSIASHKYERFMVENRMSETEEFSENQIYEVRELFETSGFEVKIGG
jgi:pyruvate formate lyase activating enzyme